MTPAAHAVRDAHTGDFWSVATVLSDAFFYGDLAPWLVALADDRADIYPDYFAMLAEHALNHGHVQITEDRHGVAIWYHHDGRDQPPIRDYDTRLAKITGPYLARFTALDNAMHQRHPHEPHHYLAFLAVHPDRHGRGYGSRLLEHHHDQLDAAGIPAYLEATGARNRALYARHGYLSQLAYAVSRTGPLLFPMWRTPRTPAATSPAARPERHWSHLRLAAP
jgi:GNAT superfamily N-acetyltransferase